MAAVDRDFIAKLIAASSPVASTGDVLQDLSTLFASVKAAARRAGSSSSPLPLAAQLATTPAAVGGSAFPQMAPKGGTYRRRPGLGFRSAYRRRRAGRRQPDRCRQRRAERADRHPCGTVYWQPWRRSPACGRLTSGASAANAGGTRQFCIRPPSRACRASGTAAAARLRHTRNCEAVR